MATVTYAPRAEDLDRLTDFLLDLDAGAALDTGALIKDALDILGRHPLIGRPVGGPLRELPISRGNSGYLALYAYQEAIDEVTILAIRHQREAGFEE